MQKQVNRSHYEFSSYVQKSRWMSIWHQLDEVLQLKPDQVLEVGPGPGFFKAIAMSIGIKIVTLDLDPELDPDYVVSVFNMPFEDGSFDVVCAFQMLEHLPFEESVEAFNEMTRVARKAVIISLPDARKLWPVSFYVPKFGNLCFFVPKPQFLLPKHVFDGEHYWEINKRGFPLKKIVELFAIPGWELQKTFRVHENPYHRLFIFLPSKSKFS